MRAEKSHTGAEKHLRADATPPTPSTAGDEEGDHFGIDLPDGLVLSRVADSEDLLLSFSPVASHPADPLAGSTRKRAYLTLLAAIVVFDGALSSTAPSGATLAIQSEFGVAAEVTLLILSLFLLGYCAGPLIWAPLSEAYGRRPIFLFGLLGLCAFNAACAAAPSFSALLILRFFAGVAGAMPATNSGSLCGDVWPARVRGEAMSYYSIATFAGPALGPLVGGYSSYASWRWAFAALAFLSLLLGVLVFFTLPETYPPLLLKREAHRLRLSTGDPRIVSSMEVDARRAAHLPRTARYIERARVIYGRPFVMVSTELILFLISMFMSFAYGLIYLSFAAWPLVFEGVYGLAPGASGLPFLSILVGAIISVPVSLLFQRQYLAATLAAGDGKPEPENRLPPAVWGGLSIGVSFLWFGWSSYTGRVHILVPTASGALLGLGNVLVFRSLQTFLIDVFQDFSASAQSANVIVRSAFGAAFPLFARAMFNKLGIQWACTLLGLVMLLLTPIPLAFIRYGPYLRRNSRYCPSR